MNAGERVEATNAVLDRFRDKPFDWAGANCVRLARAQGFALGHDLPPVPLFRSALGAKKALKKRGFSSVSSMLSHYFPLHFAPAFMRVGDLCALPAEEGLESIGIADGLGNILCWHNSDLSRMVVLKSAQPDVLAAWSL